MQKRNMHKVTILTLFESCARISELLQLKLGDVVFGSVVDKEGNRKLIATPFQEVQGGHTKVVNEKIMSTNVTFN